MGGKLNIEPDQPSTLGDETARTNRRAMLDLPHVVPLAAYVQGLRRRWDREVPDFDPMDGGIRAQALFLFEKPGPMTSLTKTGRRAGSGFVSRDTDDQTAKATFLFMREAGIPRTATAIWNVVPAWNGTIALTAAERLAGQLELGRVIELFPGLRVIVTVGRTAQSLFARSGIDFPNVIASAHPSPQVRAGNRAMWDAITDQWARALEFVSPLA